MITPQELITATGQHGLFLGTQTGSWSLAQFRQAAQFARAHNIDCLYVKVFDGCSRWYGSDLTGWHNIRATILSEGVGAIPYGYSYGYAEQSNLDTEINFMIEYMRDCGIFCADMEVEWNYHADWATHLCARMLPVPGTFLVSTWANPDYQAWQGVIGALNPCVTAYMPQQYTNGLADCWTQFGALGAKYIQPTVMIGESFGKNDPVRNASLAHQQGHTGISVWYYDLCLPNPGVLDAIMNAFPKAPGSSVPSPVHEEQPIVITIKTPGISGYFKDLGGGRWLDVRHNTVILGDILKFYCKVGGDALCGLTYLGLPLTNEVDLGDGRRLQFYERGIVCYDPKHSIDSPVGCTGTCYMMHIDSGAGQQLVAKKLTDALNASIADLTNKLKAAEAEIANNKELNDMKAALQLIANTSLPFK